MTYWPGMTQEKCGSTLTAQTADENVQTITAFPLTIQERPYSQSIEACYWTITVKTDEYKEGLLYIWMTSSVNANMHVYQGPNRKNVTNAIQQDQTVVIGAPIKLPLSSSALVVIQISQG